MIQGYAIYLRTHRKTGKQYGGMTWWTKPTQTAQRACRIRWQAEDRNGIRGLFGGFDSQIILSERRCDIPLCSDGLYRIRIAVDESAVVESIPVDVRLNKISPLLQLHGLALNEALLGVGGRIGGRTQGRLNVENGHLLRLRPLQVAAGKKHQENKTGIFAPNFDRQKASQLGGVRAKELGAGIHAQTYDDHVRIGRINGRKHKEKGTGIFAPGMQQRGGLAAVASGQLAEARRVYQSKAKKYTVLCRVPDCGAFVSAKGLCSRCYARVTTRKRRAALKQY